MSSNESDFDKLLKEAREWDARDRARHKSFDMEGDGDARPSMAGSRAPVVTIEELAKRVDADVQPSRALSAPKTAPQKRAQAVTNALNAAMKQKQAQAHAERGKRGGWGWMWLLVFLYFAIKFFAHK